MKFSFGFKKYIFPLINGLVFLFLFWFVTKFIHSDAIKLSLWSAGGFLLGVLQGFALQLLAKYIFSFQNRPHKQLFFSGILLVEFAFGVLLVRPFIWLQLHFNRESNLHSICCETPIEYGASQYENLHITTTDGAAIAGWYVAPTTQTGKVVILIHGYGNDRRGTDFQTRILIAAGYGVLLYDLRNHGESTGTLNFFNSMQVYPADLLEVLKYLKQKPEINKIGVIGISLGAFATLNLPPETLNSFSALWMDGLRYENFNSWIQIKDPLDYLIYTFDRQVQWLAARYYDIPTPPHTLLFTQIIPTITHPKLMLVSSGLDESERRTNEKLIPFMGGNRQLWIIENAWHIGGRFEVPDQYREKMLAFFAGAFSD